MAVIIIPGEPFGKPRPRFRAASHGGTYRTTKDIAYEHAVRAAWVDAGSPVFGSGPVAVVIDAWMSLPKSRPKRITSEPYTSKPDTDNIAKACTDPLNGYAWNDDSQITFLTVIKHDKERDIQPHVTMTITQIGDDALC